MINFDDISIGVDIEEISRFDKYESGNKAVLEKIFTPAEIEYCFKGARPSQHLAVRFCAKESVIKAMSHFGVKELFPKDIEVYHNGKVPQIRIIKLGFEQYKFRLSLSHSNEQAIAEVLVSKQ